MPKPVQVFASVEGATDRAALSKLLRHVGLEELAIHDMGGKARLVQRLPGFNNAARFSPWIVLIDLDEDADCAPPFMARHLPHPAEHMLLRVAVRALEAWLLADAASIAKFLGIPPARVPVLPDEILNPKRNLVDLAARSRRPRMKEQIVPRPGSGRSVGPGYTAVLTEFIAHHWDIESAATRSPSLARCVARLRSLAGGGT